MNEDDKLDFIKENILQIPQENLDLLKEILILIKDCLHHSDQNKMDVGVCIYVFFVLFFI